MILAYNYYQVSSKRVNSIITFTKKTGESFQVLFRSTPAYATEKIFDLASIIEVFKLNGTEAPVRKAILTDYDIGILIGSPSAFEYEFSLINFEVFPKGILYILTANDGVIILQMNDVFEFSFIKQLKPSTKQAYEFDVNNILQDNGQIQEQIAILYQTEVIIFNNRQQINQYQLDITAVYPSNLGITQEFIVTQIKGVTQIFNIYTQETIFKQVIDGFMAHLVNPYYTEMIIITQIDSRRYQITNGKLKFPSTTANQTLKQQINITAADMYGGYCSIPLTYKVLPSANYAVHSMMESPIPSIEFDYPLEQVFRKPASGPNIKYESNHFIYSQGKNSDLLNVEIHQELTFFFDIDQAEVRFFRIFSLDKDDSNIAILYQDKNKLIKTSVCKISYSSPNIPLDCSKYQEFSVTSFLTGDNFNWYGSPEAFYTVIVEETVSSYTVNLYKITIQDVQTIYTISYQQLIVNAITKVQILGNNIYLLLGNKGQIDIYEIDTTFKQSITEALVKSLGFVGKWNPKNIFLNQKHHSNLLIITNEENVLVIDYHKEVTIIKEITTGRGEISISIGKNSLVIVFKNNLEQFIQEYDLTHLGYITLRKQLPLYWYLLSSPSKTIFSSASGVLYVVAQDIKEENNYVILVYNPDLTLRDSLIKVIKKLDISSIENLLIASTGFKHHLCYYHTQSTHSLYVIYDQFYYKLVPNYMNDTIIHITNVIISAFNYLGDAPIIYSSTITLRNTMVQLRTNDTTLNEKNLTVKQAEQYISIGQDWLDGFVENSKVECSQCTGRIKIIKPLEVSRLWDESTINVVDTHPFGYTAEYLKSEYLLLLSSTPTINQIIIIDNYGKEQKRFTISSILNMQCDKVRISENYKVKNRFHVSCWNTNDSYRYIITVWCNSIQTCGNYITPLKFNQQFYLREMKIADSYYDSSFWVIFLDSHPTNVLQYIGAVEVQLFSVSNYEVTFNSSYKYRFNGTSTAHFCDIYVWTDLPTIQARLHIQILTEEGHLLSYYGVQYSTYYTWLQTITDVNLPTIMKNSGFEPQYNFVEFLKIDWESYNATSLLMTYSLLIQSKYASTKMILIYNLPVLSTATIHSFVKADVIFQLNGYHNAIVLQGASKFDNHVLIPYYDGQNIILAYYYIPSVINQKIISSNGGVKYAYDYSAANRIACSARKYVAFSNLEKSKDNLYYVNTIHDLREPFQLYVNNTLGDITSQKLTLTLSNEFNTVIAETKLVREEIKVDKNEASRSWLSRLGNYLLNFF